MASIFKKNEIDISKYIEDIKYMPTPDYFLVQGEKYKLILEKFYNSERISLLGSLKYDNIIDLKNNLHFIQIFENVGYKNSNGVTIEPLHSNDCQVNYDNVETYRPEVSYGFFLKILKDFFAGYGEASKWLLAILSSGYYFI